MRAPRHILTGILLLAVPACSGGDGNNDPAGPASTPQQDGAADTSPGPPDSGVDVQLSDVMITPPSDGSMGDASSACAPPPNPAGPDVVLASPFAGLYQAYDLGPVPGAPAGTPLGGCVIKHDDPNTLLIAVESESPSGAIYAVGVHRDACGHIVGFDGSGTPFATTPYVDANLVYGPNHVLFYTEWPQNKLDQLLPGAGSPALTTDLAALGVGGGGPGGLGFVPPGLPAAGGMRIITWSAGYWYHLDYAADGATFEISNPVQTATLPNGPGGFAYVPAGSPGFAAQSIIVAEWSQDSVAVYDSDQQGDPIDTTRRPFFSAFPRPWGAYFEPVTGDFLFLTWGSGTTDRVYVVQGFSKPPAIF
jgi:hypothetical protein